MRRTKKSAVRSERFATLLISLLAGMGALSVTAVILSAFAALCDMPDEVVSAMSGIALAAGCFACSFFAANRRRQRGLASGFVCGIAVFCAVLLIGSLTVRIFSGAGIITKLLIILSASALGGYKGVNSRKLF